MGQDGDEMVAYDNRPYNHDSFVIAANGGNPDFFDKKYKLLKIGGKWWMNQNLAYPIGSFADDNWTSSDYTCSGKDPNTAGCDLLSTKGYLYAVPISNSACPTGWIEPDNYDLSSINTPTIYSKMKIIPT
jgi:uncharacterized protein (TIGR02145 family)